MAYVCNCNAITDKDVQDYIEKHAEKLEAMPSNKATANIFNNLRTKPQKQADGSYHNPCSGCLQPCIPRIESMLIDAEEQRCKGYQSPEQCTVADAFAALLFEMK